MQGLSRVFLAINILISLRYWKQSQGGRAGPPLQEPTFVLGQSLGEIGLSRGLSPCIQAVAC